MCISVLIPYYNTKIEYFKDCINSILNQTFKNNIEVIIINDGSSKTNSIQIKEYINSLKKNNTIFKIFELDKNYGIAHALNYGLNKCTYNLVARMDSDDIMKVDRLDKQYEFMNLNSECVLLGGQIEIMRESDHKIINKTSHPNLINLNFFKKKKNKKKTWFINHPTVMYKKNIILKCGGYNSDLIGHSEDTFLWLQIIKNGYNLHNLHDVILIYRDCPNSLSHNFKENVYKDIQKWIKNL